MSLAVVILGAYVAMRVKTFLRLTYISTYLKG